MCVSNANLCQAKLIIVITVICYIDEKTTTKSKSCNREIGLSSLGPICPVLLFSSDPIAKIAHLWLLIFPQLGNRKGVLQWVKEKRANNSVPPYLHPVRSFEVGAKKSCAPLGRIRNSISIRKKHHYPHHSHGPHEDAVSYTPSVILLFVLVVRVVEK